MSTHDSSTAEPAPSGIPQAIGAYLIWGLFPLYLLTVRHVPAVEFFGWRILFTVPICLIIVFARRQVPEVLRALRNPRLLGLLTVSALLIAANWLTYILAVQAGHIFAASLGYYINPLVNVLAGTIFLRERMSRIQWIAVAIAAAGVSLLAWEARDMLGVALILAISFASYGLVRKLAPVGSLPGLTVETLVLVLPAIGLLAWLGGQPAGLHFAAGAGLAGDFATAVSGIATAVPLLLFAVAARRMDYSSLGFFQFLGPTIIFLLGLFYFHEPLRDSQFACFVLIWIAVGLFVWDLLAQRRRQPPIRPPA